MKLIIQRKYHHIESIMFNIIIKYQKIMCIQPHVAIQIICLFLVIAHSQRIVNFTQLSISHYNVNHEWGQIYNNLQGQDISGLVFKQVIVCEQGLKMVLGIGETVNSLRSLEMSRINGFNENIMKIIVKSNNVQLLTNLVLEDVNLEDKDILQLPIDRELSLEELSLAENFISEEGINHLSKMKMNKLRSLNLYLASLVSNSAVDSLLKFNLSNLERINIGFTSISGKNALRVISALNLSKLTHLNITYNNFDISFYKSFSQFNFTSLQSLDISNLLIDEDIVPYFKQLKFPELTKLSIGKNQFFVDGHYAFLNKKNYPRLISLSVDEVVFSQQFFKYFAKEFDGTPFQQLVFVGEAVEPQIFYYLKLLNLSQLRKLVVNRGLMKTGILYPFLQSNNFENLQELKMEYVTNSGPILHKILQKVWPKLKILRLGRIGRTNFTLLSEQTSSIKFPKLKVIAMDVRGFNSSQIAFLIQYLSRSCAQAIKIEMIVQYSSWHIQELATKQPKVNHAVCIQLKIYETTIISSKKITVFSAIIQNGRKIIIQNFFQLKRITSLQFSVNNPNPNFQSPKFVDFVKQRSSFYFSHFDFSKIIKMKDFINCQLFKYIKSVSKNQNGQCIFPYMKYLMLQIGNESCYKEFSQCKFPNLIKLSLKFEHFQYFTNNSNQYFLRQNFSQLVELHLEGQIYIPNDKVIQMFKRQHFNSIHGLVFNSSDLRSEEFSEILAQPGVQRVRNITIYQGWVQNLTFIKDNNLKLRYLDITATLIGSQLYQLSEMNYQFLAYLKFGGAGIQDNDLVYFLGNKTQKQGNQFPKLQSFALNRNQIGYEGMKLLAQSKMPYVNDLFLVINNNPDILNQMFGSTFRRISRVVLYHNMQDSVDPNLPIKNARQLQFIFLFAAELDASDFQVLSRLDFSNLRAIQIVFNQYFECQSLVPLLKTLKSIRSFIFEVDKAIQLASSECLSGNLSSDLNLKHLMHLQIQLESCVYSNMRKLFDHIVFQQTLQILLLVGVYPSEKAFRRLVQQSNLDHLSTLILRSNDLNDDMVQQIFDRDLREIKVMNLGLNENLTSQAISKMKNRTYPILFQLLLDNTKIDDSGIQTLLSCSFPILQKLDLSNTQLTSKSLALLSNFSTPNLNTINLSSNNLLAADLYNLNVKNFRKLKQIIIYPNLRKYNVDLLLEYLNKDRQDKINIVTDLVHEQEIHYHQQEGDEIDDDNDDRL